MEAKEKTSGGFERAHYYHRSSKEKKRLTYMTSIRLSEVCKTEGCVW